MSTQVVALLNTLLQTVALINEQLGNNISIDEILVSDLFVSKRNEMRHLYQSLSDQEKNGFYQVLDAEIAAEPSLHIYLLSIMLDTLHMEEIVEKIIDVILKGNLDIYLSVALEFQIAIEINNKFSDSDLYSLRKKLHDYNAMRWKNEVHPTYDYTSYPSRNKKRIVILTEQILLINHSPTKIALELCNTYQSELGYEVLLISCPIDTSILNNVLCWFCMFSENFISELNGNYVLTYKDEKVGTEPKDLNGDFIINYRNNEIHGKQVLFSSSNTNELKSLIQRIYEFQPAFVYDLGCIHPFSEACTSFTTVVSGIMSYGLPVSNLPILLSLTPKDCMKNSENQDFTYLEEKHQAIIKELFHYTLEKPEMKYTKEYFRIPEDEFLITIVGNRLHMELTEDFCTVLKKIILLDQRIRFLIIGKFEDYLNYFHDPVFSNKIYYMGYQKKLNEVIGIADLFLNPPRKGGGTSALIALYAGVPVLSLPDGDVAGNIGGDFVCRDYDEMISTIYRYITDPGFYETQKQNGIELSNYITDLASSEREKIAKIEKAIKFLDGGKFHEN